MKLTSASIPTILAFATVAFATGGCAASAPTPSSQHTAPADDVFYAPPTQQREVEFVFHDDSSTPDTRGIDDDTPWMDDNHIELRGNVAVEDQHIDGVPGPVTR